MTSSMNSMNSTTPALPGTAHKDACPSVCLKSAGIYRLLPRGTRLRNLMKTNSMTRKNLDDAMNLMLRNLIETNSTNSMKMNLTTTNWMKKCFDTEPGTRPGGSPPRCSPRAVAARSGKCPGEYNSRLMGPESRIRRWRPIRWSDICLAVNSKKNCSSSDDLRARESLHAAPGKTHRLTSNRHPDVQVVNSGDNTKEKHARRKFPSNHFDTQSSNPRTLFMKNPARGRIIRRRLLSRINVQI
jgi:hypothetical protein